jgi:hypothetical protein
MWTVIIGVIALLIPVTAIVVFIDLCSDGLRRKPEPEPEPEPPKRLFNLPIEDFDCPVCHYEAEHGLSSGNCPVCHGAGHRAS